MRKRKKSNFVVWGLLAILFILGLFFDKAIASFFYYHHNIILYGIMNFISSYAFIIPIFVLVYIIISLKNRKNLIKFPVSLFITLALVYLLKLVFNRARPFSLNEFDSFPSNHAASVFSIFPLLKDKTFKIIWLVFSILVCFSRLYLFRHFLTDVIAGIVLGYVIGYYTDKFIEKN